MIVVLMMGRAGSRGFPGKNIKKVLGRHLFEYPLIASKNSKYVVSLYELLKSYSNHIMRKNFLSINIVKLPVCTTEQGIEIIKSSIKQLNKWKNMTDFIPSRFKKTTDLKKTGLSGLFSASLELTREGLISIMQKESFDKLLVKERK